ncbi:MAG: putative MFS family arabinose efflux permease [Psychroserpens sp.]
MYALTEFEIGLLLGLNGLIIFLLEMPLIKWLENSTYTKTGLMLFGAILVGISFIILTLTNWLGILIIGMLFMTIGEMITFPFSNSYALERSKRGNQGEYMAMYVMAFSVAHVFGHNAGMQLISYLGFNSTWYIISILAIACVMLLIFLKYYMKKNNELQ